MRKSFFLLSLLLMAAGVQTADAQGFRVYQSDGTELQFSLKTDSIVFDNGLSGDEVFGPFTPVNQCIARTWYKSRSETVTFGADGTTDYLSGATYKFFPYQGNIVFFNASDAPISILKVYEVTAEKMIVGSPDGSSLSVWSSTKPQPADEHAWVDLGLPSGTLWATCNVGASKPEEYGDYFAWGETEPKSEYSWSTYKWMNEGQSSRYQINKYTFADGQTSACWYDGNGNFIGDGKTELDSGDDAATVNWGSGWRMPSLDQIRELYNSSNTTTEWTQVNGVNGRKITSNSNGNSIFLPAAGYRYDTRLLYAGSYGYYWSRSLNTSYYSYYACKMDFDLSDISWGNNGRYCGHGVRPVRVP